ncbi:hypothetical protein [Flavobacterium sharifuzzamanii]|uniref:hypothetical protein n=1 Tax=Flavobacterium sharifuzzamanii TaxID=2211133 RepID=UPI00193E06C9|nr:hypothetical protein [Flavobacterium sharifuzzamanii]
MGIIQSLNTDKIALNEETGKVSYAYAKELSRPAFVFEKVKNDAKTEQFISILYPFADKAPDIKIQPNKDNDFDKGIISLNIVIDGKKSEIKTRLN